MRRILLALTPVFWIAAAAAIPPPPFQISGTVLVDGENLPEGTSIHGLSDGMVRGTTTSILDSGQSWYDMFVLGDDPNSPERDGCLSGETVRFAISLGELSLHAAEEAFWASGGTEEVNLTAETPLFADGFESGDTSAWPD